MFRVLVHLLSGELNCCVMIVGTNSERVLCEFRKALVARRTAFITKRCTVMKTEALGRGTWWDHSATVARGCFLQMDRCSKALTFPAWVVKSPTGVIQDKTTQTQHYCGHFKLKHLLRVQSQSCCWLSLVWGRVRKFNDDCRGSFPFGPSRFVCLVITRISKTKGGHEPRNKRFICVMDGSQISSFFNWKIFFVFCVRCDEYIILSGR